MKADEKRSNEGKMKDSQAYKEEINIVADMIIKAKTIEIAAKNIIDWFQSRGCSSSESWQQFCEHKKGTGSAPNTLNMDHVET